MSKPLWRIEHTAMKHGWTSNEWDGHTPEEAIQGFLKWCDRRGEFVEVTNIYRIKNLQERLDETFADGRGSTVGD